MNHISMRREEALRSRKAETRPKERVSRSQPMMKSVVEKSAPPRWHSSYNISGVVKIQSIYRASGTYWLVQRLGEVLTFNEGA